MAYDTKGGQWKKIRVETDIGFSLLLTLVYYYQENTLSGPWKEILQVKALKFKYMVNSPCTQSPTTTSLPSM